MASYHLNNRAILLPEVSRVFISSYTKSDNITVAISDIDLDVGDSTIKFTSKWLLNKLIVHLHSYMNSKCVHKKYSTILYRKNGDLLSSLSWALGTSTYTNNNDQSHYTTHQPNTLPLLEQTGLIINELVHHEIKKILYQLLILLN